MRRHVPFLSLVATLLALPPNIPAFADGRLEMPIDEVIRKPLLPDDPLFLQRCSAAGDVVWVGYHPSSTDPNKVRVGGVWNFDTDAAGTDSTQFWTFVTAPFDRDREIYPQPVDRPWWYYDYGNNINRGNHNLWKARALAGRAFRRTGLAGVWHRDNMVGVSEPISGAASAWCGLRAAGDWLAPVDEYTGNPYTSAEQLNDFRGGSAVRSGFPGYADQWDQMLYRDFLYLGEPIELSFRFRCHLSTRRVGALDHDGGGWFSPDPTTMANFVANPQDVFQVWAGAPREVGVYDTNRRWFSEVIDMSNQADPLLAAELLYLTPGQVPAGPGGTGSQQITLTIPGGKNWGPEVRVVFRVKTNRVESDLKTSAGGFNSVDGAVVLDDVKLSNTPPSDFELPGAIRPRVLLAPNGAETPVDPGSTWITTGRPPAIYGHAHHSWSLDYADPCGGLDGAGARLCNLNGNVLVQGNHDQMDRFAHQEFDRASGESVRWAISPTLCLAGPRAEAQRIPWGMRDQTSHVRIQFDYYSGFDDPGVSGVFFYYAVRYMGSGLPTLEQPVAPQVSTWSPFNAPAAMNFYGLPTCVTYDTGDELAGYVPFPYVDSLQIALENQHRSERFGAPSYFSDDLRGAYWDNIRVGFVQAPPQRPLSTFFWQLLGDTFPVNESVVPGSSEFDTTTALVKTGINLARPLGVWGPDPGPGDGVISGDSLIYVTPCADSDTRVDLVFRIRPGPGNYSIKGDRSSAPWKVPSDPGLGTASAGDGSFWGEYMADNGLAGSAPSGHAPARWDPQTWNSARMAPAQLNYYPIPARGIGLPYADTWMGTYHEQDPKFYTLGVARYLCFLVDPAGRADESNTCCSPDECAGMGDNWPPAAYPPGTPDTTRIGTKILPDGLFTPGTHIQYFVRRSRVSTPLLVDALSPDTTCVSFQAGMGDVVDQLRFDHVDVLPDLWKEERFGGSGLACLLYVDAADRRGVEPAVRGALDSLGYGLDNGAERGWKRSAANAGDVNDPAGFVPENLGQAGLAYDKFDIRGSESIEGDRLGCRYPGGGVDPKTAPLQSKQGPTREMLVRYYSTILWSSGDLSAGAMHDGSGQGQEQANDAHILLEWLHCATEDAPRALWMSGDGLPRDLAYPIGSDGSLLLYDLGGVVVPDYYRMASLNTQETAVFQPLDADPGPADPFHSERRYGLANSCLSYLNLVDRDANAPGAASAGRYEQFSDRGHGEEGPFYASVYRPRGPGAIRYYSTLLDGFSLHRLRGWGGPLDPGSLDGRTLSANDFGRRAWLDDALSAFSTCARHSPVIAVGEMPGLSPLNFVRGAFPNPSPAGAATVQFSLAQPTNVTIRFYNVAGRRVHEATVEGVVGPNSYRWSGTTSTGMHAAAGVYFYRLSAPGIAFQHNDQRMVLLGRTDD